jgi:flagellar motor switch protein FliM
MNPPTPTPPAPAQPSEGSPATPEAEVPVLTPQGQREHRPAKAIRNYDFRQSGFLAASELRRIKMRHEQFVRALAARLAILLRVEFAVQLGKLQIVGYQKFIEDLSTPTHITSFKTDPLKGTGLLVVPPRLGLSLVDRLLGGSGQMPEANRELSEIEIALLDQVALLLIGEWCNHWPEMREMRPTLLSHESNSRFLQTATPDTAMLVMTLDAGFADQLQPILLVFPYSTVEPLVRLLCPTSLPEADAAAARCSRPKWNAQFDEVTVPVVAEWQGLKLAAGDISRLKNGDVLVLDPRCAAQVQLRFSHLPKFVGRPGMRAGKWAVELTGPVTT